MNIFESNEVHKVVPHDPSQPSLFPELDPMSHLQAPCLRYEVGEVMMNDHKFIALFCDDELVEVHVEHQKQDGTTDRLFKWTEDNQLSDTVH